MANTNPSPTFPMYPGDALAIATLSDTVRFAPSIIWIGSISGGSTIRVRTAEGADVTFTGVQAGTVLPVRVISVFSTSTTVSSLVRIF
jgi:hypothetical protein